MPGGPVDFSGKEFQEEADFTGATFSDEADFHGATFSDNAYFPVTSFSKNVKFTSIVIPKDEVYFRGTDFLKKVTFRGATINGNLIFENINFLTKIEKGIRRTWHGDFIRLTLGPNAIIRFRDVSLARVQFQGTDLRRIEFEDVEWYPLGWLIWRRQAIYDEILLREREGEAKSSTNDYALVEALYRKLKLNYEKEGDYKKAGDFHYGEMEMHRRSNPWRRRLSLYFLYWALSGYGERPSWAFGWLLGILFSLTGIVWWLGLAADSYGNFAGFWNSLIYILQKASLQRPEWPMPISAGGGFWSSISVLLLPGQSALFLLALRNRLGRRR